MKQVINRALRGRARVVVRSIFGLPAISLFSLAAITADPALAARRDRGDVAERAPAEAKPARKADGPLLVIVSTDRQRVTVWGADGKITESPVSTGREGYETPHGIFSVLGKEVEHYSNLYDDAPMPYMQRLTWSGVALHAGKLPGYPASHGCVRLPYGFSQRLFGMTTVGTRVLVVDEDVAPQPIAHPRLFTPLPYGPLVATAAQTDPAPLARPLHLGGPMPDTAPVAAQEPAKTVVASTADTAARPKRTRSVIAAERAAAMAEATAKVQASEARVRELGPAAKAAGTAAFEATKAMRVARVAGARLDEDVRRIEARIASAKTELASIARLHERIDSDAAITRAADREAALDERLQILGEERAKAEAVAVAHKATLDELVQRAQKLDVEKAGAAGALKGALEALQLAKTAQEQLAREQASGEKPITVLVSRKTGKLHVRRGFEELFESAVTIENRDAPLGTHLYTSTAKAGSADELSWSVVTLQGGREATPRPRKSRRARDEAAPAPAFEPTTARHALDRIAIPDDALEKISEFVRPGSTLIVSDNGPSRETGKGTDIIVSTR